MCWFYVFNYLFETEFYGLELAVAHDDLELLISCLYFMSAEIAGVYYHNQIFYSAMGQTQGFIYAK